MSELDEGMSRVDELLEENAALREALVQVLDRFPPTKAMEEFGDMRVSWTDNTIGVINSARAVLAKYLAHPETKEE